MKRSLSVIGDLTQRTGEGLAWFLLPLIGVTAYEVISRFIFNEPTVWAHETTSLMFAFYSILPGGYCLLQEQHVRVDVLWVRLSPRGKAIADIATCGLSFIFIVALLWFSVPWAWHSFQIRETTTSVWGPPLYPAKIFLVLGIFWLLVIMVWKFILDLYTIIQKKPLLTYRKELIYEVKQDQINKKTEQE